MIRDNCFLIAIGANGKQRQARSEARARAHTQIQGKRATVDMDAAAGKDWRTPKAPADPTPNSASSANGANTRAKAPAI